MEASRLNDPAWTDLKGAMHYHRDTNPANEGIASGVARDAFKQTNDPAIRVTAYVTAGILYGLGWPRR